MNYMNSQKTFYPDGILRNGKTDVGRTLPEDFKFFSGDGGA